MRLPSPRCHWAAPAAQPLGATTTTTATGCPFRRCLLAERRRTAPWTRARPLRRAHRRCVLINKRNLAERSAARPCAQDAVTAGADALRRAAAAVRQLSLFSSNERADDVATADLKYLLVPFYLAEARPTPQRLARRSGRTLALAHPKLTRSRARCRCCCSRAARNAPALSPVRSGALRSRPCTGALTPCLPRSRRRRGAARAGVLSGAVRSVRPDSGAPALFEALALGHTLAQRA